jgi:hypothetical protein
MDYRYKKKQELFTFIQDRGDGIVHTVAVEGGATLTELKEIFDDFLKGCGYVLPEEDDM